jgi:hypothetical protein
LSPLVSFDPDLSRAGALFFADIQRRLPLRVRTFIDFAVNYISTVLKPDKG